MRIAVYIRQILDPETIKVSRSRQAIDTRRARKIMNPPDRWALDCALRFKDTEPAIEIIALSAGDTETEDVLREALAFGCDRAVLLSNPALSRIGNTGIAKAVAAAIRRLGDVQLVLTGYVALDTGRSDLAPRLAVELGNWPVLMNAERLRVDHGHVSCLQFSEDCYYDSSYPLPVVASIHEAPEHPRYAHSTAILNAYRLNTVDVWSSSALGIDLEALPTPTTDRQLRLPPEREFGVILDGTVEEAAQALVENLKARRII